MSLIEFVRASVVAEDVTEIGGLWPSRRDVLWNDVLSKAQVDGGDILSAGQNLSDAFQLAGTRANRGQSALAKGGKDWERLVRYYLNASLLGTTAVALPGKYLPTCVKDALSVSYLGASKLLNSDIDIAVLNLPHDTPVTGPDPRAALDNAGRIQFKELAVCIVQTKTNWNDNAQVPMLWNLLYKEIGQAARVTNAVSIGRGNYHINSLKGFSYAFATVPTNNPASLKPTSTAVARVAQLSGGSYWGRKTVPGVCASMSEFFNRNYAALSHHFPLPSDCGSKLSDVLNAKSAAGLDRRKFLDSLT